MSTTRMPYQPQSFGHESATVDFVPPAEAMALGEEPPAWRAHRATTLALVQRVFEDNEIVKSLAVNENTFEGAGNIAGVNIGRSEPTSTHLVAEPGAPALRVFLVDPMPEAAVRRVLAEELRVDEALNPELPIERVVTGEIRSLPHTFRSRAAPGGISVGHVAITAGTLGCLARGASGERQGRTLILSNNHVLANVNAGTFGDPIIQPGPANGGSMPADQIAVLERFVPIAFTGAPNFVDCATAWADPQLVRRELVYLQAGVPQYFRIGSATRTCEVGLSVGKSGRTTQITSGRIKGCAATVKVNYGGRIALFQDQIEIQGTNNTAFSAPGDSGSLVYTNDDERRPVGLLFAGGFTVTFANHIDQVLTALDIDLLT